ncbi:hypothetical protein HMPREF9334_00456 [Selenomonas infelix ATCC 43532]|uniref:Uncharacterized protein n=1 Tax=Selenomonas infelix ATCC 43532 TaxID=679201 RepID=G5GMH5_9FIRM|nr:hypothetical protein [Selenomonas infelix]EHG21753.1 hypothetical protein HMPREF9334_00456 [Selenomonas infelix ATCC 43532]
MTKFFTMSGVIAAAGSYTKVVKHMSSHEEKGRRFIQGYRVCTYYTEGDGRDYSVLAEFPGTREGHAAAESLVLWIWEEMLEGKEHIVIHDAPPVRKFMSMA